MSGRARTKSPTSTEQYELTVPVRGRMDKLRAYVRPPNFDEMREAMAFADGGEQKLHLFDVCAIDPDPKLPITARRTFGHQILALAGDDLTAIEVSEHDVCDEAGEAIEERRSKLGLDTPFICLQMDERDYVFLEPNAQVIDNATSKKKKGGTLEVDLGVVETYLAYPTGPTALDHLKREKPAAIAELFRKLCELNGLAMTVIVKKV